MFNKLLRQTIMTVLSLILTECPYASDRVLRLANIRITPSIYRPTQTFLNTSPKR